MKKTIITTVFALLIVFTPQSSNAAVSVAVLADTTNEERLAANMEPLKTNYLLSAAAQMKAEDMARRGYFSHNTPEGKTPWSFIQAVGYGYEYAGENLAVNIYDSKKITKAWMNSPGHRANILKREYTEVGTGIASGMYEGREALFVVQLYANPIPAWAKAYSYKVPVKKKAAAKKKKVVYPKSITINLPDRPILQTKG